MSSRYIPYATTPGRLFGQLVSDVLVLLWSTAWVFVGLAVHAAVATIAEVGRQVNGGATGVAGNLNSAGDSVDDVPLLGDALSKPLRSASDAALDIAGAGGTLDSTATWLAILLGVAVAAPPILFVAMPWLILRIRFVRRKWMAVTLARTPAGEQLLALRALANRPLSKLAAVSIDPVGAWRRGDAVAIRGLANLELRSAGIARPSAICARFRSATERERSQGVGSGTDHGGPASEDVVMGDYLRHHDGVITLTQAQSVGMSDQAVRRKVAAGAWRRCSPGVYFADDRPFTDAARVRSAVWGYGVRAAATGLAAAWWHGITKFAPDVVEVTVPLNSHGRSRAGSRVRRRDLDDTDVVVRSGLRVSALPLTVLEAAVRRRDGARILDTALQRDVELRTLWTAHLRNTGRHGSPAARRLLHAADGGARSQAERLFKQLLTDADITGWKANQRVAGYEVDFLFRHAKVAVEIDGLAFHSDADDFHRDRIKQNTVTLAGWQVLRFTWLDLTTYPERVIAEVRHAIRAR